MEGYSQVAIKSHPNCIICGDNNPFDLNLDFRDEDDGSMTINVNGSNRQQGYPDRLHGGIISMLFDAAMTHCLFAKGIVGVTASLNIRYLQSVTPDKSYSVHAKLVNSKSSLYFLESNLRQDGITKCTATAKFWSISNK